LRRDREALLAELVTELDLTEEDATLYLQVLAAGAAPVGSKHNFQRLLDRGMIIKSGDNRSYVPVHPRLAAANHYRTWRELMVREINAKRMRVDRLILELVPVYEAATEKKEEARGGQGKQG